jgi:hypothetical protein
MDPILRDQNDRVRFGNTTLAKTRSRKHELRNNRDIRDSKDRSDEGHGIPATEAAGKFSCFGPWSFGIRICFGLRVSDLG